MVRLGGIGRFLEPAARGVLNAILPPRCLKTGVLVADPHGLAPEAWRDLSFLGGPACRTCGFPFDQPFPASTLCAACEARTPHYDRARSVLVYDEASRPLLLSFKYGDRTNMAPAFARWMARSGAVLLDEADFLIPVPLHRTRLIQRRYNQSALLTNALAPHSNAEVAVDMMERIRATPPQGNLSPLARVRNVRGAFRVRPRWRDRIGGRRVLLVDDVFTTGATVNECAKPLLRAGAAAVDVLTLARVVRAQG